MQERICRTCGESKPATTEYFNRAPADRAGLNRQCRGCRLAWARAYRAANRSKIRTQNAAAEARARDVGIGVCSVENCTDPVYYI